jgi:hypothetical protein
MKATVVPAEVTTVEDKVTANLSMAQLALFSLPMFLGSILYWLLPPSLDFILYKLVAIGIVTAVSFVLAIRINGKILLVWLVVIARYRIRPRLYIFDKRSTYAREEYLDGKTKKVCDKFAEEQKSNKVLMASLEETVFVQSALEDPMKNLSFETNKKGGLNVRVTEIQN